MKSAPVFGEEEILGFVLLCLLFWWFVLKSWGGCVEAFCGRLWASVGLFSGNRGSIYVGLHRGAGACSLCNKGTKAIMVVGLIRDLVPVTSGWRWFGGLILVVTCSRSLDLVASPRFGDSILSYYIRVAILARCLATPGKSSLFDEFFWGEDVRSVSPNNS